MSLGQSLKFQNPYGWHSHCQLCSLLTVGDVVPQLLLSTPAFCYLHSAMMDASPLDDWRIMGKLEKSKSLAFVPLVAGTRESTFYMLVKCSPTEPFTTFRILVTIKEAKSSSETNIIVSPAAWRYSWTAKLSVHTRPYFPSVKFPSSFACRAACSFVGAGQVYSSTNFC